MGRPTLKTPHPGSPAKQAEDGIQPHIPLKFLCQQIIGITSPARRGRNKFETFSFIEEGKQGIPGIGISKQPVEVRPDDHAVSGHGSLP